MERERDRERKERARRLLALAAGLGSISEACRRLGVDRSAYYRIVKVTEEGRAPDQGRRPRSPEGEILRLCLENPEWGCDRLAYYLTLTGRPVSSPTVQKILIRNGLGRVRQRMEERERQKLDLAGGPGTGPAEAQLPAEGDAGAP